MRDVMQGFGGAPAGPPTGGPVPYPSQNVFCLRDLWMPPKKLKEKRAEIAGRAYLKHFQESNYKLAAEYGISEFTVRDIIKEYKDKMDEATAAAIMYYQNHPRPVQPAASNQTAAQQLQSAFAHNFAGSRHATHPAATGSVSAAAGTMPTAMPGRLDPALLHDGLQFFSMVGHLMQPGFGSSNPSDSGVQRMRAGWAGRFARRRTSGGNQLTADDGSLFHASGATTGQTKSSFGFA